MSIFLCCDTQAFAGLIVCVCVCVCLRVSSCVSVCVRRVRACVTVHVFFLCVGLSCIVSIKPIA